MNKLTTQSNISKKQVEILSFLYRFRYLNRLQIQIMLGHSFHSQIYKWLNDLIKKGYLRSQDVPLNSTVYSLGPNAKKALSNISHTKPLLLKRLYRDKYYTDKFRTKCLMIADIYLSLKSSTKDNNETLHFYTRTDLYGDEDLIYPLPNAYFAIQKSDNKIDRYFIELFDQIEPRKLRMRINQYIKFGSNDWYYDNPDIPFPNIIIVCPSDKMKTHLYHYIQSMLDRNPELVFYLTTKDLVLNDFYNMKKVRIDSGSD